MPFQQQNLIKLHGAAPASGRTSCRSATANQMHPVPHIAAYRLTLTVRDTIPNIRSIALALQLKIDARAEQGVIAK